MHVTRAQAIPALAFSRWVFVALIAALLGSAMLPAAVIHAQTGQASEGSGVVSVVPNTALFFASTDVDPESAQVQLATELLERAGLGDVMGEEGFDSAASEIPEGGVELAIVVTSIPDTSQLNVQDVTLDPMAATGDLDNGGYAVVVGSDNPQEIYDMFLADLETSASAGGEVTTSDYNGVSITSFVPAADDDFTEPSSVALVGDYVVQAVRVEDIQPIIDTSSGTIPPLTDDENFQSLTGMLPAENLALGFINGPATLDVLQASSPEVLESVDQRSQQLLNAWTAFSFSAEDAGFRLETRSLPGAEPFPEMAPLEGTFLDNVSSDSLLAINGTNIDATGFVTTLALLLASGVTGQGIMAVADGSATPVAATPVALDQDQVFVDAESLLGFNLKTDFVDNLVGEFGFAISVSGSAMDPETPPVIDALLVSDVDDQVAVQDVVSKLSFIIGAGMGDAGTVETRDVNGSQVNVIDLTETGVAERGEFGVVDGEFVVSVGNGLDTYLLGPEASLADDPGFTAVMDQLPADYGSVIYVNMPAALSLATEAMTGMGASIEDADPSCGNFATQEEAQAAYDEDQFENFLLDQDFDGEACEDFFNPAAATPQAATSLYPNVIGLGSVSTQEDGVNGTSTFLLIDEP